MSAVNINLILDPIVPTDSALMTTDGQQASVETLELTHALTRGEDVAWRRFHELYSERLHRYLLVIARGNEDAAIESLQLTMVRVSRHIRPFEAEAVFWSWLTVLARSAATDEGRKQQRRTGLLAGFQKQSVPAPGPSGDEANTTLLGSLDQCIARLPEEDRQLVVWKYSDGESVRNIAGRLNTTEKAIESRLGRLRRELRETILNDLKNESL